MYYWLKSSVDPNVTGNVELQTEDAILDVSMDHPLLSRNIMLKKIEDERSVITVKPILVKRAILTDLISGVANGHGNAQPMISNKLKQLLEKENHPGIQFFPMTVIYKGTELSNYWLANPYSFDLNLINFEKSVFQLQDFENFKLNEVISIEDYVKFKKVIDTQKWPKALVIPRLVLRKSTQNLIVLRWVSGGIGYYFSEKLKYEIEEAGCTGIDFEPVECA